MLSPDNYISDAGFTQDYNRYSYAKNNPLLYTDPDGNNPIIGALIGGVAYTLGVAFSKGGFSNWSWEGFGLSVAMGFFSSGMALGVGEFTAGIGNVALRGAVQMAAHGINSGFASVLQDGKFGTGFFTGFGGSAMASATAGAGPGLQIASSAAFGGIVAELSGGNFWNGAAQAGIIAGFNHSAHEMGENIFKIANNLEEIIDQLNQHKVGENISGTEISNLNPKLSKADLGIKYLTKTSTGFKLKLTRLGRTLLDRTDNKISDNSDFIVNKTYNTGDKIYQVISSGNKSMYNRKWENFNLYINDNKYSIYKNFKTFTRAW